MHVHLPKPLHGWREFLGEVGIIVVGVLIALSAEQVVETMHWRETANQAREALRAEAYENYGASAERVSVTPCLDAQLDQLKARVLAAGTRLTPVTPIESPIGLTAYRHPSRLWTDAAWQSTITEQVSSHLNADERKSLAALYSSMIVVRQLNREELAADGLLMSLAAPLPLDAGFRAHLIETIESERIRANSIKLIAQQQMEHIRAVFPDIAKTADEGWASQVEKSAGTYGWCRSRGLPVDKAS